MSENIFFKKPRAQRRVVVTGVGAVSPLGLNAKDSFKNAIEGVSGIDKITKFDTTDFAVQIAGEVKNFNADEYVSPKEQKKMDQFIQYSLAATKEALEDSSFNINESNAENVGVFIGVGIGGLPRIEEQHTILMTRGPRRVSPFFIPMVISNLAAGHISMIYGAKGPNLCHTSACASSAHAIGEAYRYIRDGHADMMIAGGSEAVVCPMAIGGFASMKALSSRNDSPKEASRPWDKSRDGFVLGEGAATLILESYESASQRGAKIYAELTGYGTTSDAHHMTTPAPEGEGGRRAMELALKEAELNASDLDYINAHGTSTPEGDPLESLAIETLMGDHKSKIWVSSTKSMTGHLLGAAGALESMFSALAIENKVVPPTINLEEVDERCNLDYVPFSARDKDLKHVLSNSFGFGGTNASLIFSKI